MALKQLKYTLIGGAHDQPTLLAKTQRAYTSIKDKIGDVNVSRFAADTEKWMVDHPYKTGYYIASRILSVVPGLVTVPALRIAGFTAEDIADGRAPLSSKSIQCLNQMLRFCCSSYSQPLCDLAERRGCRFWSPRCQQFRSRVCYWYADLQPGK